MPKLPWYVYIMLGVMLVSFIFVKVLPAIRKVKHALGKGYKKNPDASLTAEQQNAINVGAVNGEQTGSFINSLTTGQHKEDMKTSLSQWWGIVDNASALETIGWLLNEGHRVYYDRLSPILRDVPAAQKSQRKALITQLFEDTEKATEYLNNLEATQEQLKEDGFVTSESDWELGILAWDTGRAVNVIRMCYDAGYISEAAAWDAISFAARLSSEKFRSWKELGKSYAIGRAMWSGPGMTLDGIFTIIKGLETDPESPWVAQPLKNYTAARA